MLQLLAGVNLYEGSISRFQPWRLAIALLEIGLSHRLQTGVDLLHS